MSVINPFPATPPITAQDTAHGGLKAPLGEGSTGSVAPLVPATAVREAGRAEGKALNPETLERLARDMNATLGAVTSLNFSVDDQLDRVVVRVTDRKSGEMIRQIPSEQMLDLAKRMRDLEGILFDTRA